MLFRSPPLFLSPGRKIVSSLEQEKAPLRPSFLCDLVREGKTSWGAIEELGDIIIGKKPRPEPGPHPVIFHESAGGAGDVMFANFVYEEAKRRGLGQEVSFQ